MGKSDNAPHWWLEPFFHSFRKHTNYLKPKSILSSMCENALLLFILIAPNNVCFGKPVDQERVGSLKESHAH